MFALVVLFGLMNGLLFLPLCLSIIGPVPPEDEDEDPKELISDPSLYPPASTNDKGLKEVTSL